MTHVRRFGNSGTGSGGTTIINQNPDGRAYFLSSASTDRDVAPTPAEFTITGFVTGDHIRKKIANSNVVEIWQATGSSTATLIDVEMPGQPFTSMPTSDGFKENEVFRYIDSTGSIDEMLFYRWEEIVAGSGVLVADEIEAGGDIVFTSGTGSTVTVSDYRHDQTTSALTWNVAHNLNGVIDSVNTYVGGELVEATVNIIDNNNLAISFSLPQTGYAIIEVVT